MFPRGQTDSFDKPLPLKESAESLFKQRIRRIDAAIVAAFLFAALEAIAIFNDGGYYVGAMSFCAVAAWVVMAGLVIADSDRNHLILTKFQLLVISLFTLFWLWTSASTFWSIASDLSWEESNRTGGYLALLIIGMLIGKKSTARWLASYLFLIVVIAAAMYAIGVKALPSVIDNYEDYARVVMPLGYMNATGLICALGVPMAVYFSADRKNLLMMRLVACVGTMLLLIALFFTVSRGAALALFFGLAIYFVFSPIRISSLLMFLVALAPAFLISLWSAGQSAIMEDGVDLFLKLQSAEPLRWYILAGIAFVGLATMLVAYIDKRVTFSARTIRLTGSSLLILLCFATIIGIATFVATREPSFTEWSSNSYSTLKMAHGHNEEDARRLVGIGTSNGRWQVWQEAIDSWQEKPLYGSGAQSFPLTHLLIREPGMEFLKQAHGLFFSLLSELGLVGLLLFSAFMSLSIGIGTLLILKLRDRQYTGLAVAIFSTTMIYLAHTSYDWDWNMYALTMPYFFFTGILIGWHGFLK